MFLQNKYCKWYLAITSQNNRELNCYTEKHHIIPKSLGGNDVKSNIVTLTAKEHYIAHLLLTKITSGINRHKMIHAFIMMSQCKDPKQERILKINSSLYNSLKEQSILLKKRIMDKCYNCPNPISIMIQFIYILKFAIIIFILSNENHLQMVHQVHVLY